jgi:hypothetical protein
MDSQKTICVICAWRQACNKKFSMDGATTTRCPDYTRDVMLKTDAVADEAVPKGERETRD